MFSESDFKHALAPFAQAVPLITVDPDMPPTVCIEINVSYIPTILGALSSMLSDAAWKTDDDNALTLMQLRVMSLMYIFQAATANCKSCTSAQGGEEVEDMTRIRVDCDCRVFVECCDGTEKELATVDMIGGPGQPGAGGHPPQPGGPPVCTPAVLNANQNWYLPAALNTGDIITITNGKGAVSNSHNPTWRCFSGLAFFASFCTGSVQTFSGDPVPSAPNGTLVINIGGTFYSLAPGTFVVPSGVVNQGATIQVNDASIAGLSGQFTFDVCVQNNQPAAWSHHVNFAIQDGGFSPLLLSGYGTETVWQSAQGWKATSTADPVAPANQQTSLEITRAIATTCVVTSAAITFHTDLGKGVGVGSREFGVGSTVIAIPDGTGNQAFSESTPVTNPVAFGIIINSSSNDATDNGENDVFTFDISGTGTDPWPDLP